MTKTDELMFMADRYAGIGLGFGDPGPQRDALRTAIEQALAEATLAERDRNRAEILTLRNAAVTLSDERDEMRKDAERWQLAKAFVSGDDNPEANARIMKLAAAYMLGIKDADKAIDAAMGAKP